MIVPGSLSPRGGRSFNECVDDMQRAEDLRNVLNGEAVSSGKGSGSGGGGWSSAEDEEADPLDDEGPPLKAKQTLTLIFFCLISCLCFYAKTHRFGR